MKPKKKNKKIKKILFSILLVLLLFFSTLFMSWSICSIDKKNDNFYNVMEQANIDINRKVTTIAMLGAHDAFTVDLKTNCPADPNDGLNNILGNGIIRALGSGLIVRLSKAQCATAKELLYSGVRYFDVRVTKVDDKYYAMHGILSGELSSYILDIVNFLNNHPNEFVVFDIQHFNVNGIESADFDEAEEEYALLFDYIDSLKNDDNKSLLDYCYYDSSIDKLSELTYGKVISNKSSGGCIILSNAEGFSKSFYRDSSIRSNWHNLNNDDQMIDEINKEYEYLSNSDYSKIFVVNQAQQTGFIMNEKIIVSTLKWSLLNMANTFNKKLVSDNERFDKWLSKMPIFMVDNATSTFGNFNSLANEYIIEYNKSYK